MTFEKFLNEKTKLTGLKFNSILDITDELDVSFQDKKLHNSLGLATLYGLYYDSIKFSKHNIDDKLIMFILLHEIAHYKRMVKLGKEFYLKELSIDDYDEFCESILYEEVFADRWARLMFYKLNNELYPIEMTQQLELNYNRIIYKKSCNFIFGEIKNNEENYKKLVENFIIE